MHKPIFGFGRASEDLSAAEGTGREGRSSRVRSLRRAVLLGIAIAVLINAYDPVSWYVIHSSPFARSHFPFAIIVWLLFLIFGVNVVLKRWASRYALSSRELAVVLAVCLVGTGASRMMSRFVSALTAPEYFASPENQWPDYVLPNLRPGLVPENARGGITRFYRGLSPGESIPWEEWASPLFWWFGLFAAAVTGCICISVILRKQWVGRERLAFPLAQVPLLLMQETEAGRLLPPIVRSRLFWIGFAIPCSMILWNTIGYFSPGFPILRFIEEYTMLDVGRGFPQVYMKLDFYVLSFAYFTHLEILFSIWLFHLLFLLQIGLSNRIGLGPTDRFDAGVGYQSSWGLIAFVVWGLWVARGHLRDVLRKAFGADAEVDDSNELLSYRGAVLGLAFSAVYILIWFGRIGVGFPVALFCVLFSALGYLGLARIVAQSGLVSLWGPARVGSKVFGLVNLRHFSDASIVGIDLMLMLASGGVKGFVLPAAFNAARAVDGVKADKRPLGWWMAAGTLLALLAWAFTAICLGYGMGAENFGSYDFTTGNRFTFNLIVRHLREKPDALQDWWHIGYGLVGVGVASLLTFLTYRVPWWPLHPMGFIIGFQYPLRASVMSIFLAWACKSIVLKFGGMPLHQRLQTAFLGILVGYAVGVTLSLLMDVTFFMGQGHVVHRPP